ncbi:MAG: SDR family NAD(P)-dependent oxidoreductase [Flavobacteriales bacterium]
MKTILIAGASSAMAQSLIQKLALEGHQIIALSRQEQMLSGAQCIQVENYQSAALPDMQEAIHGLVYFPGSIALKPFHRTTESDFKQDLDIHLFGAISVMQKYLPQLKLSGAASVVTIGTVATQVGMPFHASVSVAKGALQSLSQSLAAEYAPVIRFNMIAPSLTDTPMAERLLNTPEKRDSAAKRSPLGKVGEPDDIAEMASFLLSDKSKWMTGQTLHVDGGLGVLRHQL